jgi:hypothetical protein
MARGFFHGIGIGIALPAAFAAARLDAVEIQSWSLARIWQGAAIAVDAGGLPHVVYQDASYRLHHAWQEGRRWRRELVDGISDCGWYTAIAVDPQGVVHAAYNAERRDPYRQVLIHARRENGAWTLEEVGGGGYSPSLALGPGGAPSILHYSASGELRLASLAGDAWTEEASGFNGAYFVPTQMVFDPEWTIHACFGSNTQPYYGVRESGDSWDISPLGGGSSNGAAAIALDGSGSPRLATVADEAVRYWQRREEVWESEDLPSLALPGITYLPESVALAMDANDWPQVLLAASLSVGGRELEVTLLAFFDGVEWRLLPIDLKNAGFKVQLARSADGALQGIYRKAAGGEGGGVLKHVRIALPDLELALPSISWIVHSAGTTVEGVVQALNHGPGASRPTRIALYVSDDDALDVGDAPAGRPLKLGKLRPGAQRELRFAFQLPGSLLGKRVIALLDPDRLLDDQDRTNHQASAKLGGD